MNAVRIHAYGGPEVLVYETAPRPIIEPDEMLVRVHATSVNPFDSTLRSGNYQKYMPLQLPAILGAEASGTVEEIGANVKNFKVGDDVIAWPDPLRNGTYAEYVAIKSSNAARKPETIDHVTAATVPVAGVTALVTAGQLMPGQRVLIHGAAGGVGTFAVQIAKLRGAHVTGTASKNIDLLRELGVDEVVDYERTRFENAARNIDLVLDTHGGDLPNRSLGVLKRGGIFISTAAQPDAKAASAAGVRLGAATLDPQARSAQVTELAKLIDAGKIKPIISKVFPLEEARKAHEIIQSGHARGKIVLRAD
jgi:NADPH:quinone reductase-like Zn-dependent oxidoreductase